MRTSSAPESLVLWHRATVLQAATTRRPAQRLRGETDAQRAKARKPVHPPSLPRFAAPPDPRLRSPSPNAAPPPPARLPPAAPIRSPDVSRNDREFSDPPPSPSNDPPRSAPPV